MMRLRAVSLCLATVAATVAATASGSGAVEPESRHLGRFADFEAGRGSGIVVDAEGALQLGPVFAPVARVETQRIWSLAAVGGNLWLGTGDDGRVYEIRDGKPELRLDSPEIGVHALAGDGAGGVYAGTSPDGLVYRIDAGGQVTTFAHTDSRYVWALARDGKRLLAATGAPARVLRLGGGDPEVLLEAASSGHVRCLLRLGDAWVAGTAVAGATPDADDGAHARVYEIRQGRARLLLETDYEEVSALAHRGDTLFVAVTTTPAAAQGADGSGDARAALLRLDPGGASYPVWEGPGVWAGLTAAPENQPASAPGAGLTGVLREPGRVLRLAGRSGDAGRVAHIDSLLPNALLRQGQALWVGDGRTGRLWKLAPATADSGWFDVPVQDLGAAARWGALDWDADVPGGTRLRLRSRSGQSATPDETWSPWSAAVSAPGAAIASPAARYLQLRVVLNGKGDASPRLRRLSFTARQANLPPVIDELTTFAYRGNPQGQGPPPAPSNGGGNGQRHLPQSKTLRLVRWQTHDDNGDDLRYRLYLRGEGQRTWKLAEDDIDSPSVIWDTETMPEGMTQLRLVASDAEDNPPGEALEDEWVSEPFAIDNSPPEVRLQSRRDDGAVVVEASFADRVSRVRGARLTVDYADAGRRLAAADGLYDSRTESARVRLDDLSPGEHVLSVQVWDELDNVGVGRLLVTVEK